MATSCDALRPGQILLDPTQPLAQAEATRQLLEAGLDAGPDGTQVRARGWTWHRTHLVLISCDN